MHSFHGQKLVEELHVRAAVPKVLDIILRDVALDQVDVLLVVPLVPVLEQILHSDALLVPTDHALE